MPSNKDNETQKGRDKSEYKEELIQLAKLSFPLVISYASSYTCRIMTTIFAGQYLGTDEFDAVALGQTMTNITGYSMIIAFVSPMDSLCTQANGAKNWKLYSLTVHRALFCCSVLLIPIIIFWFFMYDFMIVCGQNPTISYYVYQWTMIYIAVLPAYVCLCVARRFLSSQCIGNPLLCIGIIVYCIWHPILLCFVFLYLEKREFIWAPLCNVISIYINAITIILYCIIFRPHHPLSFQSISCWTVLKWETNWKQDTFINKHMDDRNTNIHVIDKGLREYFQLLIAGIFSLCAEWWSWEVITILCGLLGPTQLAVHVVFVTVVPLYYMIPLGVGMAGASRVGKLIGENRFHLAKYIGSAILWFTLIESVLVALISFAVREYLPLLFTKDKEVIDIAIQLSPLFCLFLLPDAFQGTFQGILRAIKKQGKSVIAVVVGPWLITIPLACLLSFNVGLKIFGMWIANNVGYIIMNFIFLYLFLTFKWNEPEHHINGMIDKHESNEKKEESKQVGIMTSMNISHFSAFLSVSSSFRPINR